MKSFMVDGYLVYITWTYINGVANCISQVTVYV